MTLQELTDTIAFIVRDTQHEIYRDTAVITRLINQAERELFRYAEIETPTGYIVGNLVNPADESAVDREYHLYFVWQVLSQLGLEANDDRYAAWKQEANQLALAAKLGYAQGYFDPLGGYYVIPNRQYSQLDDDEAL